jgi:hypothetical protein
LRFKVAKLKTINLKPKQKKKMKLLIISAIRAFDKDIKMLKQADVKTFTYKEVTGSKDISEKL